jgi:membrane protein
VELGASRGVGFLSRSANGNFSLRSMVRQAMTSAWRLLKTTIEKWVAHKDARQGAALAYYSVFSVGPLMVIAIGIAGLAFGPDAARGEVQGQLSALVGQPAAAAIDSMLASANKPQQGLLATAVGTAVLLFSALGVVVQLKDAFNTVWEVDEKNISGAWQFIRTYLMSMAAVLGLGFLLLISLLFTTGLSAAGQYVGAQLPQTVLQVAGSLISFAAITAMFAVMFKLLPDTDVEWRDVWLGAAITAALFELGKLLIGIYVGKLALASTYGAAASLVILLIWVYYSSQIVLLGAEFTHCYASRYCQPDTALPTLSRSAA